MKKLPLGLFIGYLVFISAKSHLSPVTIEETLILGLLGCIVVSRYIIRHIHGKDYRRFLIAKEEIDLKRPRPLDPEIAELERINSVEALKLKKFITEQEYNKREVSRAFEKNGGLRF